MTYVREITSSRYINNLENLQSTCESALAKISELVYLFIDLMS